MATNQQQIWEEYYRRLKLPTFRGHRPYAPNWGKICYHARSTVGNRCVNCWNPANLVHHFYYSEPRRVSLIRKIWSWLNQDNPKLWRKIYGWEQPGISVVPLCSACHALVHQQVCWFRHESNPDLDANYPETIEHLRNCYWELAQLIRLGKIAPIPNSEQKTGAPKQCSPSKIQPS